MFKGDFEHMSFQKLMYSHWHSRTSLPSIIQELGFFDPNDVGAEIGTQRGMYASFLLQNWPGHLVVVDPWRNFDDYADSANVGNRVHEECRTEAHQRLNGVDPKRWTERRMTSLAAASITISDCLSFAYLDARHDYESVKDDINAWWRCITPGGILCGHDFVLDGWHMPDQPFELCDANLEGSTLFGVRRAVNEFSTKMRLPLYISSPEEDGGYQSWAIRKPL